MRALVVATVSALLIASSLALVALPASADGSEIGVFPDRTFVIVRSPPGSPRTDAYAAAIPSDPPGTWRVILTSSTISSVVVEVYEMDAGIRTLLTASKLTRPGDKSSPVPTLPGHVYSADFTPYGKAKGEATRAAHQH